MQVFNQKYTCKTILGLLNKTKVVSETEIKEYFYQYFHSNFTRNYILSNYFITLNFYNCCFKVALCQRQSRHDQRLWTLRSAANFKYSFFT